MKVARIDKYDMENSPGTKTAACTIWFSGCSIRCPDCHNKELWDYNSGKSMHPAEILRVVDESVGFNGVRTVVLLGGEPLDQYHDELQCMCKIIKNQPVDIQIWLYTGYDFENIPDIILDVVDVIKAGRYDESQKADKWLGFLSSSNQKLWRKQNHIWVEDKL